MKRRAALVALGLPVSTATLYALHPPWPVVVILAVVFAGIGIAAQRWAGREARVGLLAEKLNKAGCDARTKHDVLLAAVQRPPSDD